jgi:hypothetical protein
MNKLIQYMTERGTKCKQEIKFCIVWSIPCECGRSYVGETGRPLTVRLHVHRHNLKEGLLEKSKLAENYYEEGHKVGFH